MRPISRFREFRATLLAALARRDTAFLYGILAPEIKNSFGGDDGVDGFRRIWEMDNPATPVWTALTRVLSMGGEQSSDTIFVAPYVYAIWPHSIHAFEHVVAPADRLGPAIVGHQVGKDWRLPAFPPTASGQMSSCRAGFKVGSTVATFTVRSVGERCSSGTATTGS